MAACDDRQLTQAEREAAFQQQRTGVVRAVRPFSGSPTVENLIDYINRELGPAVRSARDKVNDIYLQVADQAPSANPLHYFFAESVVDADPTVGRIRLNQSVQNTATVIRISETNALLESAFPWLDVMAGSATVPIGVVTLVDAKNPGRFVRWDLESMVDMGTYWNLNVTPLESSHPSPFVEGEAVTLGFIPGVASATGGGAKPILPPPMFLPRRNTEDEPRRGVGMPGAQGPRGLPGADGRAGRPGEDGRRPLAAGAGVAGSVPTVSAGQQLGRQIDSGAINAPPIPLTGAEQGENIRFSNTQTTTLTGTQTNFALDPLTDVLVVDPGGVDVIWQGFAANSLVAEGKVVWVRTVGIQSVVFKHEDTGATAANRFRCPDEQDFILLRRDTVQLVYSAARWTLVAPGKPWIHHTSVTWAAQQDDFDVTGLDRLRVTLTGDQTLTGIVPRAAIAENDGQTVLIENIDSTDVLTIAHSSASSSANNQFRCPDEVDFILSPRCGVVARYDGTSLLWRLMAGTPSGGRLIVVTEHINSSGTHTFDARTRSYIVEIRAPGGGGGGANSAAAECAVGASGGKGAYFRMHCSAPPASESYDSGTSGTAGASTGGDGGSGTAATWSSGANLVTVPAGGGGEGSAHATRGSGSGTTLGFTGPGGQGGVTLLVGGGGFPTGSTRMSFIEGEHGLPGTRISGTVGWGGGTNTSSSALSSGLSMGALSLNNTDRAGSTGHLGRITVWEFS